MSDSSPGKLPGSISSDVSAWLRELCALLGQVQVALEHVQLREGTSADVRELIDQLPAPPRSLLVAPANGAPSAAALTSRGWLAVKTVTEPTGQPVFVIYEKK